MKTKYFTIIIILIAISINEKQVKAQNNTITICYVNNTLKETPDITLNDDSLCHINSENSDSLIEQHNLQNRIKTVNDHIFVNDEEETICVQFYPQLARSVFYPLNTMYVGKKLYLPLTFLAYLSFNTLLQ